MHRPLEPPAGYEHYYTAKAVFPGLRGTWRKMETWEDHKNALKRAWKLYKHDYIPDPEITEWEKKKNVRDERRIERRRKVIVKKGKETFEEGSNMAEQVIQGLHDKRPEMEQILKHRVGVLSESLDEFGKGYQEGYNGTYNFVESISGTFNENGLSTDVFQEDNKPLKYQVKVDETRNE